MLKPIIVFLFLAAPAFADSPATAKQIRAAVSGNTVQGNMSASGAYSEFYAADGIIRGKSYTGTWTTEGDAMCFAYGEAPVCWQAVISGDQISWIVDGTEGGTGTILPGNPNTW